MSFLNMALLGGMAAVLAPLLIHLLNRTRYKSVDWGAMHLLESAMQVNTRRFQWESILLLAIRCGIPTLLAIGLARPVLTYSRIAGARGNKSVVLVVDDSLSMTRDNDQDATLFEAAQRELIELSNGFRTAEMSLWAAGVMPKCLTEGSTLDRSRIATVVRRMRAGTGNINIVETISQATTQVAGMNNPNRHIIFASDFCESDWKAVIDSDLNTLRDQLASSTPPIQLSLLNVASRPRNKAVPPENLGIHAPDDATARLLPNETGTFTFAVHNYGPKTVKDVSIVFSVDGRGVAQQVVTLAAGEMERVPFACNFPEVGWHLVQGRIEGDAGPVFDDRCPLVVQVAAPVPVLVLTDRHVAEFHPSTDYLRLALAPFTGRESELNRFQVRMIQDAKLSPEDLQQQQVVVIAGVDRLDASTSDLLVEFVRAGGGLIIFPDEQLDRDWINQRFYDQDNLLPMRFGGLQDRQGAVQLMPQVIQIPQLQILNSQLAGELSEWEVSKWEHLEEPGDKNQVILSLSNGDVFLTRHAFGKGSVLQCAVSCDDDWSNMPVKSAFVPFMQQLMLSAASKSQLANFPCGESITVSIRGLPDKEQLRADYSQELKKLTVSPIAADLQPIEDTITVAQVPLPGEATWADTRYPGVFRFEVDNAAEPKLSTPASEGLVEPPMVVVRGSLTESDLSPMSATQLQQVAEQLGAVVVGSAADFVQNDRQRQVGRELWKWLLGAVLVLLVAEVFVVRHLSRGAGV